MPSTIDPLPEAPIRGTQPRAMFVAIANAFFAALRVFRDQLVVVAGEIASLAADVELRTVDAEDAKAGAEAARDAAEGFADDAEAAKTAAQTAKGLAEAARDATLTAYDNFDDRFLGEKASDPATDNDGNALTSGRLYWNTAVGEMRVYHNASWHAAYVSGDGVTAGALAMKDTVNDGDWSGTDLAIANGGTGASTAAGARTNLELVPGTHVQAYDADLTNWAAKTAPSGTAVGTTDTQTLSGKTLTMPQIDGIAVEDPFLITDAAGFVVDPANGGIQRVVLGASRTPVLTSITAGKWVVLDVDDGSAYALTLTSGSPVLKGTFPGLKTTGWSRLLFAHNGAELQYWYCG